MALDQRLEQGLLGVGVGPGGVEVVATGLHVAIDHLTHLRDIDGVVGAPVEAHAAESEGDVDLGNVEGHGGPLSDRGNDGSIIEGRAPCGRLGTVSSARLGGAIRHSIPGGLSVFSACAEGRHAAMAGAFFRPPGPSTAPSHQARRNQMKRTRIAAGDRRDASGDRHACGGARDAGRHRGGRHAAGIQRLRAPGRRGRL